MSESLKFTPEMEQTPEKLLNEVQELDRNVNDLKNLISILKNKGLGAFKEIFKPN